MSWLTRNEMTFEPQVGGYHRQRVKYKALLLHSFEAYSLELTKGRNSIVLGEIANNNKRLNTEFLAWDEMRVRSFFDIKAGGVDFLRHYISDGNQ